MNTSIVKTNDITEIRYGLHESLFGMCFIGASKEGIYYLSFLDKKDIKSTLHELSKVWPDATLHHDETFTKPYIEKIFSSKVKDKKFNLLVKGTPFQMKVWEALREIPRGKTVSYSDIAKIIGTPKAVRAVGTACGKNSMSYLIPCHRVLTSTGKLGGYRWGIDRKKAILEWESR